MKHAIIAAALALTMATGAAGKIAQGPLTMQDKCAVISNLAETVMDRRQAGVAMVDMMALAYKAEDKAVTDILVVIIRQAWDEPLWSGEERKASETGEFRDQWALACYSQG